MSLEPLKLNHLRVTGSLAVPTLIAIAGLGVTLIVMSAFMPTELWPLGIGGLVLLIGGCPLSVQMAKATLGEYRTQSSLRFVRQIMPVWLLGFATLGAGLVALAAFSESLIGLGVTAAAVCIGFLVAAIVAGIRLRPSRFVTMYSREVQPGQLVSPATMHIVYGPPAALGVGLVEYRDAQGRLRYVRDFPIGGKSPVSGYVLYDARQPDRPIRFALEYRH
ncbi:hypothetical protein [Agrococcus casei]|uniref:hypothetical protein n=2 Tax=Agrococcus casei TaxID=343512 RepID=UPI000B35DEC5|nr:hypothetical protein [Agrococcus casei]